ncbi:MAG: arginyl-tRNA synthetase, partial [Halothiobacillaceae bacterium]
MKQQLESLISQALATLRGDNGLSFAGDATVSIERTRDKQHGDFACNIALTLAKTAQRKPRELAEMIVAALPHSAAVDRVEIAGPGFINFFMAPAAYHCVVNDILSQGSAYGRSTLGAGKTVQIEFVSANPTGPLHVGHGRGAAYGAAVADVLAAAGYTVHREYYVNDAGRQMDILATSVWLRYLEQRGENFTFPSNGYKGEYIHPIAASLQSLWGDRLHCSSAQLMAGIPADAPQGGDKEQHIDALVERAKTVLGADRYRQLFDHGLNKILADIRQDLEEFGVIYDDWFSERSLTD